MPDFAIVNIADVNDALKERANGLVEGRFTRTPLGFQDIGISRFTYAPNFRSPQGHSHKVQEEGYVVVSGSGRVVLDGEVNDLKQWDVVRVAANVVRAFEAGPDGLDLVAVGGPKPEEGDGVMAEGSPWPADDGE